MKKISLASTGFELVSKRKRVFLDEMSLVVPWRELVGLIQPFAPTGTGAKGGRPTFAVETMLRIHFLQQWFGLSDPAMEEALHDTPLYREFARLDAGMARMPDETTILRFCHLLEGHNLSIQLLATINATLIAKGLMLKTGTVVDATLIAAPSSTKNSTGERDPEMYQTKKGNQWHFGMKAHIGVDADSGLVHTVIGTAANVNDVTQGHGLLHGEEVVVFADAGYQGSVKRSERALQYDLNTLEFDETALRVSLDELLLPNSRLAGGMQTFPRHHPRGVSMGVMVSKFAREDRPSVKTPLSVKSLSTKISCLILESKTLGFNHQSSRK